MVSILACPPLLPLPSARESSKLPCCEAKMLHPPFCNVFEIFQVPLCLREREIACPTEDIGRRYSRRNVTQD